MDYRQFYITSLNETKMSSRFRKDTFTAGDITLVAVIGDERKALEFEVVVAKELVQTFNSNSWPRSGWSYLHSIIIERTFFKLATIQSRWLYALPIQCEITNSPFCILVQSSRAKLNILAGILNFEFCSWCDQPLTVNWRYFGKKVFICRATQMSLALDLNQSYDKLRWGDLNGKKLDQ